MTGQFQERFTHSPGNWVVNDWKLKRYEITLDGAAIETSINDAVEALLGRELPTPDNELAAGFVVVHHGVQSVWVLADLWTGDIICQHTFSASLDDPTNFERVPVGGPTACVWELPVHHHERNAWVQHVLDPSDGPDLLGYFANTLAITPKG